MSAPAPRRWTPDAEDARLDPRKMEFFERRAHPQRLADLVTRALELTGVPHDDARLCADILVDADLRGSETHGTALLRTHYVDPLRSGQINPTPAIRIDQGAATTVAVDGDNGLGMVVGARAMERCIELAREYGSGWAACYRTTHSASGGYYVRMAARARMVGFHWSTGGSTIAAPGRGGRLVGNNPFSFGAPVGDRAPFVLDMAPSATIRPKIRMLGWQGRPIPPDWAVDEDGAPITDPQDFFDRRGAILPLGGTPEGGAYKGFGLQLVADIMSGGLTGDGGSMVRAKGAHTSALGAVAVEGFPTGGEYDTAMEAMSDALRRGPAGPGGAVRYPGERAEEEWRRRTLAGVPLRRYVVTDLAAMCDELGLALDDVWTDEET